jgi:TolA-binding protein
MRLVPTLLILLSLASAVPARAATPDEQIAAASALFDARKYPDAAQKLEAFLAANGKHAKAGPAALALGRCYTELKQWAKAIPAYEKALASGNDDVVSPAQLGLGEAAIYGRQFEKAAAALTAATKSPLKPEQASVAWYWLGQANFQIQRFAASEEAYGRVTRDFPRADFVDDAHYGAGLAALRQGKTEAARTRLRTVVTRFPSSADRPLAMVLLAQIDADARRYREARAGYEAVLNDPAAKAAGNEVLQPAEEGLIHVLLELQDYAAALPRLESALARLPAADPQRFRAALSLGHCRFRQRQYDPAFGAYREAAKSTEAAVAAEGHYWAGNTLLAMERPGEAAAQFAQVVTRFPKHELASKAQLKAANAYTAAKQLKQASDAFKLVVDRYPQSPEAAEARKALGELVDATDDPAQLAAALKNAPTAERARGTVRLARLHLQKKQYPEAQKALADALAARPAAEVAAEAQYLLGVIHDTQDKAAPAAAALSEAVRLDPDAEWAADAQVRLAWRCLELKQAGNAEKAARAALALKLPADGQTQARLALIQAEVDQQKWTDALDGCEELLGANPSPETTATLLYTQAWIGEKQGKAEQSMPLWERLAADFPKSRYAAEALLRVADAQFKAEKYDEARQKYGELLSGFPKSPLAAEARFKQGSALYNLNRFAEAAVAFDGIAASPASGEYVPEALYWAGVALDKAGKKPDAVQRLTKLVNQFPKHARVANAKVRLAALNAVK